jgi:hypothetical protein
MPHSNHQPRIGAGHVDDRQADKRYLQAKKAEYEKITILRPENRLAVDGHQRVQRHAM